MEVTEALLTRTGVFFCFLLFFLTQVCFSFSTTPLFCSPFHGCACSTSRERRRVAFSNFLPTLLASFPLFFGHLIGPGVLSVPIFIYRHLLAWGAHDITSKSAFMFGDLFSFFLNTHWLWLWLFLFLTRSPEKSRCFYTRAPVDKA